MHEYLSSSLFLLQILHCNCSVDRVRLPVTVTQQSPVAISMDTYQITIAPVVAKVPEALHLDFSNLYTGDQTSKKQMSERDLHCYSNVKIYTDSRMSSVPSLQWSLNVKCFSVT